MVNAADIAGATSLGTFVSTIDTPISQTSPTEGTYADGVLTLNLNTFFDQPVPNGPIDLIARITVAGTVVAEAVPEPSTFALAGIGALALFACRLRHRSRAKDPPNA